MLPETLLVTKTPFMHDMKSNAMTALGAKDITVTPFTISIHLEENTVWMDPFYPIVQVGSAFPIRFENVFGFEEVVLYNFRIDKAGALTDDWVKGVTAPEDESQLGTILTDDLSTPVDFEFPKYLKKMVNALLPIDNQTFSWVKFDLLAMKGGDWFFADPRVGVKR